LYFLFVCEPETILNNKMYFFFKYKEALWPLSDQSKVFPVRTSNGKRACKAASYLRESQKHEEVFV
jgi:hypothetical protein